MTPTLTRLLHHLRRLSAMPEPASDADLLARFACRRDEDAFAALVARHGPMVLNTCRRILGDAHTAEDAFQATFLVLARKAGCLRQPDALAGWLHGVACRVAFRARRGQQRLPRGDFSEPADPRPDPLAQVSARDLIDVLEQEVQRLPRQYRLPVVMCCLEGLGLDEAAQRLGWTPGSVKGRLERGRKRLHDRLARRGLALTAALALAEVSRGSLAAALSALTVRSALAFAAGPGPVAAEVSQKVLALATGGLQSMSLSKFEAALAILTLVGLAGAGLSWLAGTPRQAPGTPVAMAGTERPGAAPKGGKSGRDRQIERIRLDLDRAAAAAVAADRTLTEKVVEAREQLVDLEEQLREAQEQARLARLPSAREVALQKQAEICASVIGALEASAARTEHNQLKLAASRKQMEVLHKEQQDSAAERFRAWKARSQLMSVVRKKKVRVEETIRQLERKREASRNEAEGYRETAAARLNELEGGRPAAESDRALRTLQRSLKAIERDLAEIRREIRRPRSDREK